jgi:hypothetical protein
MQDRGNAGAAQKRVPWNKGKLTGAKPPPRPKHVWSIRTKFQIEGRARDLRTSQPAGIRRIARPFGKRKPGDPSDSN